MPLVEVSARKGMLYNVRLGGAVCGLTSSMVFELVNVKITLVCYCRVYLTLDGYLVENMIRYLTSNSRILLRAYKKYIYGNVQNGDT